MNPHLLIDAIVRQTTVLIAQLATAAGVRAPLAHVAADVFGSLVAELKQQGLGSKVIADMFGLALRTYHNRMRRYAESATDRGISLWEAVLLFVRGRTVVTRAEVLKRFHADDQSTVRAVLKDLVDSGLLFRSGRADHTTYRAARAEEVARSSHGPDAAIVPFVWVLLHQRGALSAEDLARELSLKPEQILNALSVLIAQEHVREQPRDGGSTFHADDCVIQYGDEQGWEAALFDHYQAMVTAIAAKVRSGATVARQNDATGGSTFHFDLYRGHPLEHEALSLLERTRELASELRRRVEQQGEGPVEQRYRLVFYAGQHSIREESDGVEV